ncbi:MAG: hypothetical protein RI957_1075 [Verrucomicrobiota bacterium]|jgi:hypothetical protein
MAEWKQLEYPGGEIYQPLGHLSFFGKLFDLPACKTMRTSEC